jgi:inhibitor of cysteine peptidase
VKEFSEPGQTVRVAVGEEFTLLLRAVPTTGYRWVPAPGEAPAAAVELLSEAFAAPESNRPGAATAQVFRFRAVSPGPAVVRLRYARPWEDPSADDPRAEFAITVTADDGGP